jgi:uncharacterized protein (DUF1786 family)
VKRLPETGHKILAIDIGQGTQDILLYDPQKNIENCISLILPSPSAFYGKLIESAAGDLYIYGSTIGGGMLSKAIKKHLKKGYAVYMESEAAASIRDSLERVRSMGIQIGPPPEPFNGQKLQLREVNLPLLKEFLAYFSEATDVDAIAIAVQDHGASPEGSSDRLFRFELLAKQLSEHNNPEQCARWAGEVPSVFTRMTSLVKSINNDFSGKVLVMDTALCAVLGCMEDHPAPYLIVNAGNDHTMCAVVENNKITALLEHHTAMLSPEKLRSLIIRFAKGEVTHQEVFEDWGHGALYINKTRRAAVEHIIATGPLREKIRLTGLHVTFAAPGGNMMLTGPIGLVKACKFKLLSAEQL